MWTPSLRWADQAVLFELLLLIFGIYSVNWLSISHSNLYSEKQQWPTAAVFYTMQFMRYILVTGVSQVTFTKPATIQQVRGLILDPLNNFKVPTHSWSNFKISTAPLKIKVWNSKDWRKQEQTLLQKRLLFFQLKYQTKQSISIMCQLLLFMAIMFH